MSSEDKLLDAALSCWDAKAPPADFQRRVLAHDAARRIAQPSEAGTDVPGWWSTRRRAVALYAAAAVASLGAATALLWPAPEPAPASPPAAAAAASTPGVEPFSFPASFASEFSAYIDSYGYKYGDGFALHGVVLAGTSEAVTFERAHGRAVLDEDSHNTPETRFRIGALTMPMVAALTMRLVERGEVSLHDPVGPLFGELPPAERAVLERVTVHQLLTHTSGIANYSDLHLEGELLDGRARPIDIVSRMIRWTLEMPGEHAPGEEMNPSNTGYLILGLALERKTGRGLGLMLREEIFEPAGMQRASLGLPEAGVVASGHLFNEATEFLTPAPTGDPRPLGAAGGVVASAHDLWAFTRALSRGKLVSAESLERMTTEHASSYGYGLSLGWGHGQPVASHPGGLPGFNGALIWLRAQDVIVVALANTEVVDARDVVAAGAALAMEEDAVPHEEYDEVPYEVETYRAFAGGYELAEASREKVVRAHGAGALHTLGAVTIEDSGDRLLLSVPNHGRKWMHGLAEDSFFFKDGPGTTAQVGVGAGGKRWLTVRQGKRVLTYVMKHSR